MSSIVNFFIGLLNTIVSLLPHSPVSDYLNSSNVLYEYMPYVNYFVPVGTILDITAAFLLCLGSYYIYSVIARWIKVIR